MSRLSIRCALAVLATFPLAAQVTIVPNTGCGQSLTSVQGTPGIGQQITIVNPFVCAFQGAVVAVGTAVTSPFLNCLGQGCPIGVQPIDAAVGIGYANYHLQIPNQPTLIGFCFRAQSACLQPTCLMPDRAVQICVQ